MSNGDPALLFSPMPEETEEEPAPKEPEKERGLFDYLVDIKQDLTKPPIAPVTETTKPPVFSPMPSPTTSPDDKDPRVVYKPGISKGTLHGSKSNLDGHTEDQQTILARRLMANALWRETSLQNADFAARVLEQAEPSSRAKLLLEAANNPNTIWSDIGKIHYGFNLEQGAFQLAGYAVGVLELMLTDPEIEPEERKQVETRRTALLGLIENKAKEWEEASEGAKKKDVDYFKYREELGEHGAGWKGVAGSSLLKSMKEAAIRGSGPGAALKPGMFPEGQLFTQEEVGQQVKEMRKPPHKMFEGLDRGTLVEVIEAIDLPRKAVALAAMGGEWEDLFVGEHLSPMRWANFVRQKAREGHPAAWAIYNMSRVAGSIGGLGYAGLALTFKTLTDRMLDKKSMSFQESMQFVMDSREDGTSLFINVFTDPSVFVGITARGTKTVLHQIGQVLKRGRKVTKVVDGKTVVTYEKLSKKQIKEISEQAALAAEQANINIKANQASNAIDLGKWERILKKRNLMREGEDIVSAIKRLTGTKTKEQIIALKRRVNRLEAEGLNVPGNRNKMERLAREIQKAERVDIAVAGGVKEANAAAASYADFAAVFRRFNMPNIAKAKRAELIRRGLISGDEADDFIAKIFDDVGGFKGTREQSLLDMGLQSVRPGGPAVPTGYVAVHRMLRNKGFSGEQIREVFGAYGQFYGQSSAHFALPLVEDLASLPWRVPGMQQHQVERAFQRLRAVFRKHSKKPSLHPQKEGRWAGKRAREFDVIQEKILKPIKPKTTLPVVASSRGRAERVAAGVGAVASSKIIHDVTETLTSAPNHIKRAKDSGKQFHEIASDPMWKMENAEGVVLDTHEFRANRALEDVPGKQATWKRVPIQRAGAEASADQRNAAIALARSLGFENPEEFIKLSKRVAAAEKTGAETVLDPVTGKKFTAFQLMDQLETEGFPRMGPEFSRRRGYTPENIKEFNQFVEQNTQRMRAGISQADLMGLDDLIGRIGSAAPVKIKSATGQRGAAKYDRESGVILYDEKVARRKYDERAWTTPRKLSDGSEVDPLNLEQFRSFQEWRAFVIEHEWQHSKFSYEDFVKSKTPVEVDEFGVPMVGLGRETAKGEIHRMIPLPTGGIATTPVRLPEKRLISQAAYENELNERALAEIAGFTEREGKQIRMFEVQKASKPFGEPLKTGTLASKEGGVGYFPAKAPTRMAGEGPTPAELEARGGGAGFTRGELADARQGEFGVVDQGARVPSQERSNVVMRELDEEINIRDVGSKRKIVRIGFKVDDADRLVDDPKAKGLYIQNIRSHNASRSKAVSDKRGVRDVYVPDEGGTNDFKAGIKKMRRLAEERVRGVLGKLSKKEVDEIVDDTFVFLEHEATVESAKALGSAGAARTYKVRIRDLEKMRVRNMEAVDVDYFPDAREIWGVTDEIDTEGVKHFVRPLREGDEAIEAGRARLGARKGDLTTEELEYANRFRETMNRSWEELVTARVLDIDDVGFNPLTKTHYPRRYTKLKMGMFDLGFLDETIPVNSFSSPSANKIARRRARKFGLSIADIEEMERLKLTVPAPFETLPHYAQEAGRAITKRKLELVAMDIFGRPKNQYLEPVVLKPGNKGKGIVVTQAELDDVARSGKPRPYDWRDGRRTTKQWNDWAEDARDASGKERPKSDWKMMENARGEQVIVDADIANWLKDTIESPEKMIMASPKFARSTTGKSLLLALRFGKGMSNEMKRGILLLTPGFHKINFITDTLQLMSLGMTNPVKFYRMARKILKDPASFTMKLPMGTSVSGAELLANARKHNLGLNSIERLDTYGSSLSMKEKLQLASARTSGRPIDPVKWWIKIKRPLTKKGEQLTGWWVDTTQLAGFLHSVQTGHSYALAAERTFGALIDYGDRDIFLNFLRAFVPFATWAAKAPYATAAGFARRPVVYQTPIKWRRILAEAEWERRGKDVPLPAWTGEQAAYLRLPEIEKQIVSNVRELFGGTAIKEGEQVFARTRGVPLIEAWQPILSSVQGILGEGGNLRGMLRPFMPMLAPWAQHGYEAVTGTSVQTGQEMLPPDLMRPVSHGFPGAPPARPEGWKDPVTGEPSPSVTAALPGQPGPVSKYYWPYMSGAPVVGPLFSRPGMLALDMLQYNWPGREGAPPRMFGSERQLSSYGSGKDIQAQQLMGMLTGITPLVMTPGAGAVAQTAEENTRMAEAEATQKALKKIILKIQLEMAKEQEQKEKELDLNLSPDYLERNRRPPFTISPMPGETED